MADQPTLEQFYRWWSSLGEDMRRQALQGNMQNMGEHLPTLLAGLGSLGPRGGGMRANPRLSAEESVRMRAREMAAQAQRDYYARMAAQATGHAPRPNPTPARGETRPAPSIEDTTARIRERVRAQMAQGQRDYYARAGLSAADADAALAAQSIRRAPEPPSPMNDRLRAMREFEAMQPPPRNQMHSVAGAGAGGAASPYFADDLDFWWSQPPQR